MYQWHFEHCWNSTPKEISELGIVIEYPCTIGVCQSCEQLPKSALPSACTAGHNTLKTKVIESIKEIILDYNQGGDDTYSNILGIETKKYNTREIYSVRGGPQNDGLDYYVYEFSKECGQDIIMNLDNNSEWCSDRLDDKILNNFIYNKEILEVKNGYYHYELVCRTRDENKKKNVTKENATGCEIGVYDADKNILYYYWQSI